MKRWRNLRPTGLESGRDYSAVLAAALCCMMAVGAAAPASAADWPMYRHDGARSGITPEAVTPPLAPHWVFQPRYAPEPAWPPPKDYPVEGILELPRNRFDDVFHVAAAGGLVYFGSAADNKVYALDAATGKVRWEFFTGGPVRTAPTVWKGRVFAASDDGWVYCLRAADGSVVWKLRAAAGSQRLLGNGKMISLWPVRTDVLVDNDIAYFAAGIFPSEGVCLYAVRASDGTVLWKNDWAADETRSSISPQGYLLVSSKMLFAPMGRISPAAFDRADGTFRYFAYFGKNIGGSYALVADEKVYTGTTEIVAHSASTHRERFAHFSGRKIIVAKDAYYVLSERDMTALDRVAYPRASNRRRSLLGQRSRVDRDLRAPKSVLRRQQAALKQEQKKLDALKKKLDALNKTPQPDPKAVEALMAQVNAQAKRGEDATRALDAAKAKAAPLQEKRAKLTEQIKGAMAALKATVRWRTPCDSSSSLIMAGGVLFAGGKGKVLAFDATDGKPLWTGQVDGDARGLAAASGRLLVSTDKGTIHCFGQPRAEKPTVVTQPANPNPFPKDALTPLFEQAAEAILEQSRVEGGYALVLGVGTGRLAYELAKRTDLMIYAVDPDPARVAAVRKVLDEAGLYGKRIVVEQAPPQRIPYADYFADLIVSERALLGGKLPFDPKDARRMLKPCGGVLLIGQPPAAKGLVQELKAGDLERFAKATGDEGAEVVTKGGRWVRLVRGPLKGAGTWTHQYGTPGNIASSTDQLVECPLGVLWFGEPGPRRMINRHEQAPAPLVLGHRMFIQGEHVILCYDVYNGRKLWERKIQGARRTRMSREASNLALNEDTLFVAVGDKCLALDVRTGATKATHALPPAADGKPRRWGYVAVVGDLLYGSSTRRGYTCNRIFAVDIHTGQRKWTHEGGSISHITIAIGDGRMFFADSGIGKEERDEALKAKRDALGKLKGTQLAKAQQRLKQADVRRVVALDAATGKLVWQKPLEVTDCRRISRGGGELIAMYHDGVLLFCAASANGHFWRQFFGGDFAQRGVIALSGRDGSLLWERPVGYRIRPLIIGDTLIAEPWAFDLKTGTQKMRNNPITGEKSPWQFARPGHHCGAVSGSPKALFFRSWTLAYYDLKGDYGTQHFGGQRLGCWINTIPASGLVVVPESGVGCMCAFPTMCTIVFQHRKENKAWAMYSISGKSTPVVRLAINLGAPGDRKSDDGTLWLGYPRPGGSLVFQYRITNRLLPGGGYFRRNARALALEGTDKPWVFASGCRGLRACSIPLIGKKEPAGTYTVRLHFIDLANAKPGERVFDVKLQGEVVLKEFDIIKAAGGPKRPLIKEFQGIQVRDNLLVELVPKDPKAAGEQAPVLSGIEVIRTKMQPASLSQPTFELCDFKLADAGAVTVINHTNEPLVGKLLVGAHEKITMTPASIAVRLAPKAEQTYSLKAACGKGVPAAEYSIPIRLVGADGATLWLVSARVSHSGKFGRVAIPCVADVSVRKGSPTKNTGGDVRWWVDGGSSKMGDKDHAIAFLRFPVDRIPGRPVSVKLRLYVGTWPAAESGDSGRICLVKGAWQEKTITYATKPELGDEVGRIGRVGSGAVIVRPLKVTLGGKKELSLALVPTSNDGAGYYSREGGKPAELIVEYGPDGDTPAAPAEKAP